MATTYVMNNLLVSCLMFFAMIGSLNAKPVDTTAICGKAQNPSFCTNFMKSSPKTSGADIKTLATMTFRSAQLAAIHSVTRFQNVGARQTNPALKKGCTSCVEQYTNTLRSLDDAENSFNSGDGPALIKVKVSAAMKGPTTCQDGLAKFKADPSISERTLATINYKDNVLDICGIILVISDMK